ncbi:hypothetical protein EDD85DRAFT_622006 [Armillaria nabsnona]|nr:hypothetical protein EDD85DRAFT_622006 [Armillaria nabsnona]
MNTSAVSPAVKDVEALLLKERSCRRRPGDVPYPLDYNMEMLNFDIWDHMFFVSCCRRSISMHQFDKPPALVLDLGCGSGHWAIEAAKYWPSSTIIGFDLKEIQPRLYEIDSHKDLARRVKWLHGNLLDGLPFPPDHFDFVRVARIGLGVPEDEWQYVLEEVSRVMKPGAPIELLEEDLIFPCPRPVRPRTRLGMSINTNLPDTYSTRSSTTLSASPRDEGSNSSLSLKSKSTLETLREHPTSGSHTPYSSQTPDRTRRMSNTLSTLVDTSEPSPDHYHDLAGHPQDHSKLKAAWEAMLSRRFLAPQLLSVLPFYLSSCFTDVQTHPTLSIDLPPNSRSSAHGTSGPRNGHPLSWIDLDSQFVLKSTKNARRSNETDDISFRSSIASHDSVPSWAVMHLAKTVQTIMACKEAIWDEYKHLQLAPELPPVVRTPKAFRTTQQASVREDFDSAWANWQNDMMDRIGMRDYLALELSWPEPVGERPDWRIWRDNVDIKPAEGTNSSKALSSPDLCRALKGFVAWKPR